MKQKSVGLEAHMRVP